MPRRYLLCMALLAGACGKRDRSAVAAGLTVAAAANLMGVFDEAGRGFTKEDWDSVDSPELTDEELASMRPAR